MLPINKVNNIMRESAFMHYTDAYTSFIWFENEDGVIVKTVEIGDGKNYLLLQFGSRYFEGHNRFAYTLSELTDILESLK